MADRAVRSINYQMKIANFPAHRYLTGFDFAESMVTATLLPSLHRCECIEEAQTMVLIGAPGTGTTHLATAPASFKIIVTMLATLNISACETIKIPQATGGSRADGVVELSFEYGKFEKPLVQWDQALVTAKKRCAAWNYTSAEAFGGTVSECQARDQYGCARYFVTAKYQCTRAASSN